MRAVLVFCEGMHDVVFITRSLGQSGGTWVGDPIDQLPTPFGRGPNSRSFIVQLYGQRNLGERPIQAAIHAPKPSFAAVVRHEPSDTLYLMLQSDADRSSNDVVKLLELLTATLMSGRFDVQDVAAAFVFDADASLTQRSARFRALYSTFFGDLAALAHGGWLATAKGPLGLFVFHDAMTQQGTLESLLGTIVQGVWPTRWSGAGTFIDEHAEASDPVRKSVGEEIKARITIAGQLQCPGDPMSIVLGRNGLPASCFDGPHSRQLVDFLLAVPWS
jgi:hypothetical protein